MQEFQIAVIPGDGIGIEIMAPCLEVLDALVRKHGGFRLRTEEIEAGVGYFQSPGTDISDESFRRLREANAILLGAIGLPDIAAVL